MLEAGGKISPAEDLGSNDPPELFLKLLQSVDEDILIASHLPFVARVVSQAVTGSSDQQLVDFRPGSIAVIERNESGAWHLIYFAGPGLI